MNRAKPGLDKAIKCLSTLSDTQPRNIRYVQRKANVNRNFVSALLHSCANFGLVTMSTYGRSETFMLTLKAVVYLKILHGDYRYIVDEIQEILAHVAKIRPKRQVDFVNNFLVTIGTTSSEPYPPYFKLQTLTDAFTLASCGYHKSTPEHRVFNEIASLLKVAASVFSPSKQVRKISEKFLRRALDLLESIQTAEEIIELHGLPRVPVKFEEIGKDGRGQPIYRVK